MSRLTRELEDLGGADITAALDEVPVHSFLVGSDGIIRWQNKASLADLGSWSGRRWPEPLRIPEGRREEFEELWRRILSGEPVEFSTTVTETDGTVVAHDVSTAPLRDGSTVIGLFGVAVPAQAPGRRRVEAGDLGLTKRQLEVLKLLAEGESTSQIAAALYISKTTVRNHIAHVLASLGVHTRVQAVVVAQRAGLVEEGPRRAD